VICDLTGFHVSGFAILIGAEMNAVIDKALHCQEAAGRGDPGERKKIGPAAERAHEEQGDLEETAYQARASCTDCADESHGNRFLRTRRSPRDLTIYREVDDRAPPCVVLPRSAACTVLPFYPSEADDG